MADAGDAIISELPSLQAAAYAKMLRKIFERMGDRLAEAHAERQGEWRGYSDIERIKYSLNRVQILKANLAQKVIDDAFLLF